VRELGNIFFDEIRKAVLKAVVRLPREGMGGSARTLGVRTYSKLVVGSLFQSLGFDRLWALVTSDKGGPRGLSAHNPMGSGLWEVGSRLVPIW
jgi:hypothetical protein